MIEPYVSEKQCTKCLQCKPETEFPLRADREGARFSRCRDCRKEYSVAHDRKRRAGLTQKRAPVAATPVPSMDLIQQLACVQLRKWRGPVDTVRPLVWRLAA
jgi:hypothetical protein